MISEKSEHFDSMASMMEIPRESESEAETEYIFEKSEIVEIEVPESNHGDSLIFSKVSLNK